MGLALIDGKTIKNFTEDDKAFDVCTKQYFSKFDVDKDELLSKNELQGGLPEIVTLDYEMVTIMEKFDADRDGKLALNEFKSLMKEIMFTMARGIGNSAVLVALDVDSFLLKAIEHEKCKK